MRVFERIGPVVAVLALGLVGCGGDPPVAVVSDAGSSQVSNGFDAGAPDSGSDLPVDSGVPTPRDAGRPDTDAGTDVTAGVVIDELAPQQTAGSGLTPDYTVDIGPDVESFLITGLSPQPNTSLQVIELRNPDGEVLAQGQDHFTHKSRSVAAFGAHATLVPESADFQSLFIPGTYRFKITAAHATSVLSSPKPQSDVPVKVVVFKKRKSQPGVRQTLDINLFFTGAAGVDAAAGQTNARITAAVAQLRQIYSQVQIELGQVRYFDTPPGYDTVTDLIPTATPKATKNFPELFRLSEEAPPGLNFFFVEALDPFGFGALFPVLGISGGIPGPTMIQGTDRSGVVVLFDVATWVPKDFNGMKINDDFLGTVMAHEGGHFLGLSHTYEALAQGKADNLSDTPKQNAADANSYLMQPSATSNGGILSELQGLTLRRNPAVRSAP